MIRNTILAIGLAAAATPASSHPAAARADIPQSSAPRYGDQARDHASILKMAGVYKVTFDMRETTPLVAGYTPYPAKVSGGHEVVRAIVDTPDRVVLQHLLVVNDGNGKTIVVKHWRQDWVWQPESVLVYAAPGTWTLRAIPVGERKGSWSQTVWQTDDSPRYGGIGRWRYDDGAARWVGDETRRPLARRDATRKPPYDHYQGTNHHVLTPTGWVHEQENAKIGEKDGKPATFVHEYVINTYAADPSFSPAPADAYWTKTKAYWASVRANWDGAIDKRRGLRLAENADNGSVTGHELMLIADDVASGETSLDAARGEAADLIARDAR